MNEIKKSNVFIEYLLELWRKFPENFQAKLELLFKENFN